MEKELYIELDTTAEQLREIVKDGVDGEIIFNMEEEYEDADIRKMLETNSQIVQMLNDLTPSSCPMPAIPRRPLTIRDVTELYPLILGMMSKKVDEAEEKNNCKCCCKRGCNECCKSLGITINYAEALIIKYYLEHGGCSKEQLENLKLKIKEQADIISHADITGDKLTYADNMRMEKELATLKKRVFDLHLPCVFLNGTDCLIQKVKPLDCWAFRQYITPKFCENAFEVMGAIDHRDYKIIAGETILFLLLPYYGRKYLGYVDTLPTLMDMVLNGE